jgi:hypothetical protein
MVPQGLKPTLLLAYCGTTEVVPFQGPRYETGSRDEGPGTEKLGVGARACRLTLNS